MNERTRIDNFLIEKFTFLSGNGNAINLSNYVREITLNESIDNMFVTGTVKVVVPRGLFSDLNCRFTGEDLVNIKIKTFYKIPKITNQKSIKGESLNPTDKKHSGVPIDVVLVVMGLDYSTQSYSSSGVLSETHDEIVFNLISAEGILDKNQKVKKAFSKKNRVEIIKQIYNDYLKLDNESSAVLIGNPDCENDFTCIIPNWAPSKAIAWLLTGCYDSYEKNYLFFQRLNRDKIETIFDTFSNIAKKDPIIGDRNDVSFGLLGLDSSTTSLDETKDIENRLRTLLKPVRVLNSSILEHSFAGTWASKAFFYDITRKKYFDGKEVNAGKGEFVYRDDARAPEIDDYKKFITTDEYSKPESFITIHPKQQFLFHTDEEVEGVDKKENWFLENNSQKNLNMFSRISITTIGDTDVRVGETVTFSHNILRNLNDPVKEIKKKLDTSKEELGGTYIIWGIERVFKTPTNDSNLVCENRMILLRDGAPL